MTRTVGTARGILRFGFVSTVSVVSVVESSLADDDDALAPSRMTRPNHLAAMLSGSNGAPDAGGVEPRIACARYVLPTIPARRTTLIIIVRASWPRIRSAPSQASPCTPEEALS